MGANEARDARIAKRYAEDELHMCRRKLKEFLDSKPITFICFVLIFTNVIFVGVETDLKMLELDHEDTPAVPWNIIGYIYTGAFTIEVTIRMIAEGSSFFAGSGMWWNVFDLIVVFASILESTSEMLLGAIGPGMTQNRLLKALRICRIARTLRIGRMACFISALRVLIMSVMVTMRSLFWALLLLLMMLYAFAIFFTSTLFNFLESPEEIAEADIELLRKYWGTVPRSAFSLFCAISNGFSWYDVCTLLAIVSWFNVVIFLGYFIFAYFALLNVMTGVFCQHALDSANLDKEIATTQLLADKSRWVDAVSEVFHKVDNNKSGSLDLAEFQQHVNDEKTIAHFAALDIDVTDAWAVFKLLDVSKEGSVDLEDFVDGLMRVRGPAKAIHIADLKHENAVVTRKLEAFMEIVDSRLSMLMDTRYFADALNQSHNGTLSSVGAGSCGRSLDPRLQPSSDNESQSASECCL